MKRNNPAGRLYSILDKARRGGQSVPAVKVWQEVLELKDTSQNESYKSILALKELVHEVKFLVQSNERMNKDLFLSRFEQIEAATNMVNLGVSWGNFRAFLDEATMLSLAHIAEEFSKLHEEKEIAEEVLWELHQEIAAVAKKLSSFGLDQSLRIFLLDQLSSILRSIDEYHIRGAKGIEKTVAQFYGSLLFHYKSYIRDKSALQELLAVIERLSTAVISANDLGNIVFEDIHSILMLEFQVRERTF